MTKAGEIYGKSLYDLAKAEGLDQAILNEMESVRNIFNDNPDYIRLLSEPSIPRNERLKLLDEAFGDSMDTYLLNFIKILTEKGFLREFGSCFKTYRSLYNDDRGICDAVAMTPGDLSDDERTSLIARLEKITGKKVLLTEKKDPALLGGIKVLVEGKLYDGSVRGRLDELRRRVDDIVL
ncbi:MAG: ATP synthase F1 subunit delta [Clostridiales bacterium]|nr:ATP synthase F1 subunit delta [Clostridiales bacterium]